MKKQIKFILLVIILIIFSLVVVSASIYFIYMIPESLSVLQSIITTIVAAVYGGLLTLAGVILTIRYSKQQQELSKRLEYKPFIILDNSKRLYNYSQMKQVVFYCSMSNKKIGQNDVYYFGRPVFTNVGDKACILKYIKINSKIYALSFQVILPNQTFYILPSNIEHAITLSQSEEELNSIKFGIYDINYNLYEYEFLFEITTEGTKRNSMDLKDLSDENVVIQNNGMILYKKLLFNYVDCSTIECKKTQYKKRKDISIEKRKEDFQNHFHIDFDKKEESNE